MEVSKDEFKTSKGTDGSVTLLFDSKRADECCKFAISNGITSVSLYPEVYVARDLIPLLPLANHLKGLLLDEKVNYDALYDFRNLTFLSIPDNGTNTVDLSSFSKLEKLSCNFSSRLKGLQTSSNLKSLSIGNYKSKQKDLSDFPSLKRLEHFNLIKPDISSLNGIKHFSNLKKLQIYSASKLESIAPLRALTKNLEELEFEKCKKITDYEILGEVPSLKKIMLSESGEMNSISFVKKLPKLEFISFWGTNVLDGNLEYCDGLNYVGFDNKRHYSHKSSHFN